MRVSVIKEDPGYIGRHITGYEVYLNGEKLDNCITADEEQGIALVFVTDEHGKLVMNEERTDLVKKWVKGDIKIIAPPWHERLRLRITWPLGRFMMNLKFKLGIY